MKNVAYFSLAAIVCFSVSVSLVVYQEARIIDNAGFAEPVMGPEFVRTFEIKAVDWSQMVLGISAFMSIFEGNSSILVVYAEADKPKHFLNMILIVFSIVFFGNLTWGILSYYSFGDRLNDLILVILPIKNRVFVCAKTIYYFNVCGSYILWV